MVINTDWGLESKVAFTQINKYIVLIITHMYNLFILICLSFHRDGVGPHSKQRVPTRLPNCSRVGRKWRFGV